MSKDPLNKEKLVPYLSRHIEGFSSLKNVKKFSIGQSNPTFLLETDSTTAYLKYSGNEKFKTTTDGVKITGGLQDEDGHVGAAGSILSSTGTALDWIPASSLGGVITDKIQEGDTSAEVIDAGSDGRFIVTTEGTERFSINASGEATFVEQLVLVVILMLLVYQQKQTKIELKRKE